MPDFDQALAVRELNHVALHVRDLDASVRFYRDVLGLTSIPIPNFNFTVFWFALGSQELHLIADADGLRGDTPSGHLALTVDDAYAASAVLRERGVTEQKGPAPRPDGPVQVFFHDPDGHLIEMVSFPASISAKT